MKKSILILALISIALIFVAPQVNASDRDVGYSFVLSADNAAVVAVDCQAVMNFSSAYVKPIELRDPGDMCSEAEGMFNMPAAPLSGYLFDILINYKRQDYTRLASQYIRNVFNPEVMSTSNGGAGY